MRLLIWRYIRPTVRRQNIWHYRYQRSRPETKNISVLPYFPTANGLELGDQEPQSLLRAFWQCALRCEHE
jgi:hypothetical protein